MPENALPQPPSNTPPPPSSTPPGGAPTAPAEPPVWHAGTEAPEWARGKTAQEILGIATKLVDSIGQPAGQAVPQAAAAQTQYNASHSPVINDDDYMTGAQVRQLLANAAATQVTPAIQEASNMASSANLGLARQMYAKDFARYGPEITAKLATVPRTMWTLDNLETVVKLVRSDHIDDLARERAQEIAASVESTIRSSGAGGAAPVPADKAHSLESEKIPAEWKQRAVRAGVTEELVREFCQANEISPADFYKQFDAPRNRIVEDISEAKSG